MTEGFTYEDAKLSALSLLLSLVGPSFSGKTMSSLRLATGIQRVTGGEIALVDTENGRATHYANDFKFKHVPLRPPFSPLRYLEALEFCAGKGARIVIVDSGSHCWEGAGGVLEQHETELDRMAGNDWKKRDKMNFAAWIKPKKDYTRLVTTMLQLPVHMIWCFRAKEKIEIKRGEKPTNLGYESIAGKEMKYEFMAQALLYPSSGGVPEWNPTLPGEKTVAKLPVQFAGIFKERKPLCEDHGEAMARWASGEKESSTVSSKKTGEERGAGASAPAPASGKPDDGDAPTEEEYLEVMFEIEGAADQNTLTATANAQRGRAWSKEQRAGIKGAIDARQKQLKERAE